MASGKRIILQEDQVVVDREKLAEMVMEAFQKGKEIGMQEEAELSAVLRGADSL
jgi:hypothetical protein